MLGPQLFMMGWAASAVAAAADGVSKGPIRHNVHTAKFHAQPIIQRPLPDPNPFQAFPDSPIPGGPGSASDPDA